MIAVPRSKPLKTALVIGALMAALASPAVAAPKSGYDVVEKSITQIQADLASGKVSSVELVRLYEARIAEYDGRTHAILVLNPDAMAQARAADAARKRGGPLGPLAGVPVLLKDNIETKDPMATTAGSLALKDNVTGRDAPLAAKLRAAGAIILGKTNLSEWANYRSSRSISGWSGVRGQTHNAYALDRTPCGSSAGSGVAASASFAAATVGTETNGSVTCPASINGLVGLKPTVGLISRTHVVPISHTQDTAGPMVRSVKDAAILLAVMAGSDPADPATAPADNAKSDYVAALKPDALKGVRIGVMRFAAGFNPDTDELFEKALAVLKAQGATLVEIKEPPNKDALAAAGRSQRVILNTELKQDLGAYLASTDPAKVKTRTLADLIAFNAAHAEQEMPIFKQELFVEAEKTTGYDDADYLKARADSHRAAGPEGIDALLKANDVTALIAPTVGPAGLIDPVLRDRIVSGGAGGPPAIAGYPHLTVPMGLVDGLPVGLSFIGAAWDEARLLAYGYAYEQASQARRPPTFRASVSPPGF